ncbi:MAG: 16S rRNA (cytosine(967)-C(5))-methyltransferase RsmB [Burkholderiaceae bacterium]
MNRAVRRAAPSSGHSPSLPADRRKRLPPDSLAFALLGAARVCVGVRAGHTLRDGLERERRSLDAIPGLASAARLSDPQAAIHDLAARALRRRGKADALLATIGQRIPEPALLRELMVVSIALLVDALSPTFAIGTSFDERVRDLPYSPFTLVDQAVHAASSDPDLARGKGFVNAVLRTLLRRLDEEPQALQQSLYGPGATDLTRFELPSWWVARLRTAYPDRWQAVVERSLEQAPLVVRVNRRRTSRDAYLAGLHDAGIDADPIGFDGVRFAKATSVQRIPGFADGVVSVQDEAAQRAAPLLGPVDGMRVLDACAAPGGKTGHLLEIADIDLVALDSDAARLARVRENLERLGLVAQCVTGDAATPDRWWDGRGFDRILADVPCTASGILRRHPDIRWLRRETDIDGLSRTAQQITAALWSMLNPGGRLLLVTCSIFPEESVGHADQFLARHADAVVLAAPGQLLPASVGSGDGLSDHDGLFFALFEKMR